MCVVKMHPPPPRPLPGLPLQVSKCYPRTTARLGAELMALLEEQHAVLDPGLRRTVVQALILMRNRNQVSVVITGLAIAAAPA